jgi:ribonucleoside-diphosphate reductase alpha chain
VAYRASIGLAEEKGSFPDFDRNKYLKGPFIRRLPENIRRGIADKGIRNSHLIAIAPTGTISLLAGNVSSGLEPIFAALYRRKILDENGEPQELFLADYAVELWRRKTATTEGIPPEFVTVEDLPVHAHLNMQAALQPFVDNSISKTINVPEDCPFSEFRQIYDLAFQMGLKGCTTFRPNPVTGVVLSGAEDSAEAPHCCVMEREAD